MKKIGITTTVPAEILIAAGYSVVDLNNSFIGSPDPAGLIGEAEKLGFPRNTCAWIKGIFSACMKNDIREIVGVVEGDCSNTKALLDVFKAHGVQVMKIQSRRAAIVLVFVILFVCGTIVFIVTYVKNASTWAQNAANKHLYKKVCNCFSVNIVNLPFQLKKIYIQ